MNSKKLILKKEEVPQAYRNTPIELLLAYNNLGKEFDECAQAKLIIGTCIDNRICFRIPDNFAYIFRQAGANMQQCDFSISYVMAVGSIRHVALIGHTDCKMVDISAQENAYVENISKITAWSKKNASEYFKKNVPICEIGDQEEFTVNEATRLKEKFPNALIAPMLFNVDKGDLCLLQEK